MELGRSRTYVGPGWLQRRFDRFAALGAVLALLLGGAMAAKPVLVALAVVGLIGVAVVWRLPLVGVAAAVLADGIVFPLLVGGQSSSRLNLAVLFVVVLALAGLVARRSADDAVLSGAVLIGLLVIPGVALGLASFSSRQVVSGARYLCIPVMVAVLAPTVTDRQMRLLLRAVTCLMLVSFVATIVETYLGSDRLLKLTHLDYGVSIRNFGEALRAPGTFATNFHLGAFSAVFCVVTLLWWGQLEGVSKDFVWRVVATVSALGCLALSTYRTGVVIVVVAVVAAAFLAGNAVKPGLKIAILVVGGGLAIGFAAVGLADTTSLFQRFQVWSDLVTDNFALLGHGIGYAGAASGTPGSRRQIFTDNYYLSLWLQFGLFGLLLSGLLIALLVKLLRAGRRGNRYAAVVTPLWIGTLVGLGLVELWEYTSAMSLVGAAIGSSLAGGRRRTTQRDLPVDVLWAPAGRNSAEPSTRSAP